MTAMGVRGDSVLGIYGTAHKQMVRPQDLTCYGNGSFMIRRV